jgi:hypothetical protein
MLFSRNSLWPRLSRWRFPVADGPCASRFAHPAENTWRPQSFPRRAFTEVVWRRRRGQNNVEPADDTRSRSTARRGSSEVSDLRYLLALHGALAATHPTSSRSPITARQTDPYDTPSAPRRLTALSARRGPIRCVHISSEVQDIFSLGNTLIAYARPDLMTSPAREARARTAIRNPRGPSKRSPRKLLCRLMLHGLDRRASWPLRHPDRHRILPENFVG